MVKKENFDETRRNFPVYPRPGSAMYNLLCAEKDKGKKSLRKWKFVNKYLTIPLYKIGLIPLVGLGRIFLLLKTVGRKSGRMRTTPLEYHRIDGEIHIFSGRGKESDWFKNLKVNPDKVWVHHGFHRFKPEVHILKDDEEKAKILRWYVEKHPMPAERLFGWDPENDDPKSDDLKQFAKSIPIIRLKDPSTGKHL
jgi:deazaflavin-dependent oxidoreductase (nitroreductase family)